MILIADAGSTKTDWVAFDSNKKTILKTKTLGLNPTVFSSSEIEIRIKSNSNLIKKCSSITAVFFYGAGCGSKKPKNKIHRVLSNIFSNAKIVVKEDIIASVLATTQNNEGIVAILGTGSNSCYFDGVKVHYNAPSIGYMVMDEASGNYFGKQLLRDYFYNKMPVTIKKSFKKKFNLEVDIVKEHLYQTENPNAYLANFTTILKDFKDTDYSDSLIKKGFEDFFNYQILPFEKLTVPLYFVGSIAYHFQDILIDVAQKYEFEIKKIIQKPIDDLVNYHKNL